jgi:hypothetical protein
MRRSFSATRTHARILTQSQIHTHTDTHTQQNADHTRSYPYRLAQSQAEPVGSRETIKRPQKAKWWRITSDTVPEMIKEKRKSREPTFVIQSEPAGEKNNNSRLGPTTSVILFLLLLSFNTIERLLSSPLFCFLYFLFSCFCFFPCVLR